MTQIFCDNDGVLADFDSHIYSITGKFPASLGDSLMWEIVESHPNFWMDINKMEDADELWDFISPHAPVILTGCPKTGYEKAEAQKPIWVRENFGSHVDVITCLSRNKQDHMIHEGDILIDDMPKNIVRWEKAGGKGILHTSAKNTIRVLKHLMKNF